MTADINHKEFYLTFKEGTYLEGKYCIILARVDSDARKCAQKNYRYLWKTLHNEDFKEAEEFKELEETKLSPITVSYGGWNPDELSNSGGGGGANLTKIRSRNKDDG